MAGNKAKGVIGVKEAAYLLRRHPQTVRKMAEEGVIPARRQGELGWWEFRRDELVAWLTRSEVPERQYSGGVWRK